MALNSGSFSNVASITTVAAISVTYTGATSHTITAGKRYILFQNNGTKAVWMGDSSVDGDNDRGHKILPTAAFEFRQVEADFDIYFIRGGTDTSTISVVEG